MKTSTALFAALLILVLATQAAFAADPAGEGEWREMVIGGSDEDWEAVEGEFIHNGIELKTEPDTTVRSKYKLPKDFEMHVLGDVDFPFTMTFCRFRKAVTGGYELSVDYRHSSLKRNGAELFSKDKRVPFTSFYVAKMGGRIYTSISDTKFFEYRDRKPLQGDVLQFTGASKITSIRIREIEPGDEVVTPFGEVLQEAGGGDKQEADGEQPDKGDWTELVADGSDEDWTVIKGEFVHNGRALRVEPDTVVESKTELPKNYEIRVVGTTGDMPESDEASFTLTRKIRKTKVEGGVDITEDITIGPKKSQGERLVSMMFARQPNAGTGGYSLTASEDMKDFSRDGKTIHGTDKGGEFLAFYVARIDGRIYSSINDELFFEYKDTAPLQGGALQFGTNKQGKFTLTSVRVREIKPDDQVVSPFGEVVQKAVNDICPVTGAKASDEFKTDWNDLTIRFSSADALKRFEKDPDSYLDKLPPGMKRVLEEQEDSDGGRELRPAEKPEGGDIRNLPSAK